MTLHEAREPDDEATLVAGPSPRLRELLSINARISLRPALRFAPSPSTISHPARPLCPSQFGPSNEMVPSLDSQIYTSPTFILSLLGALLATVLGIIKLFEYRKDRANIKVTVKAGYKQYPPDPIDGDYHLLFIDAVNIGRRPANITSASLMLPKEGFLLCVGSRTGNYPVELTEGKSHSFTLDEDRIKEKYKMTPSQYVGLVCDATGRKYYGHSLLSRLWKVGRI